MILSGHLKNKCEQGFSGKLQYTALGPAKTDWIPAIFVEDGQLKMDFMLWSLCPKWSKEFPCKWSTYNARLNRIYENKKQYIFDVPTFKESFRHHQFCLIPIKGAIEACYFGDDAGSIIKFYDQNESLFVLGLYEYWIDPKTKEYSLSTTLLTDGPYEYLYRYGHDRSVIGVDPSQTIDFLFRPKKNVEQTYDDVLNLRKNFKWSHEVVRPMKEGWQKRVPTEDEIKELEQEVWKENV